LSDTRPQGRPNVMGAETAQRDCVPVGRDLLERWEMLFDFGDSILLLYSTFVAPGNGSMEIIFLFLLPFYLNRAKGRMTLCRFTHREPKLFSFASKSTKSR